MVKCYPAEGVDPHLVRRSGVEVTVYGDPESVELLGSSKLDREDSYERAENGSDRVNVHASEQKKEKRTVRSEQLDTPHAAALQVSDGDAPNVGNVIDAVVKTASQAGTELTNWAGKKTEKAVVDTANQALEVAKTKHAEAVQNAKDAKNADPTGPRLRGDADTSRWFDNLLYMMLFMMVVIAALGIFFFCGAVKHLFDAFWNPAPPSQGCSRNEFDAHRNGYFEATRQTSRIRSKNSPVHAHL